MSHSRLGQRPHGLYWLERSPAALLLLVAALAGSACSKETKPAAEQPRAAAAQTTAPAAVGTAQVATTVAPAEAAPGGDSPAPAAASSLQEANFALELKGGGAYRAGQPATAEIVLLAKDPFKVNDKYPYKFKTAPSEGIQYAAAVIKDEALKLEKKQAVMTVAFTPESSGPKKLAGTFSFSVCTEERCLIEKRDLALDIKVD